MATSAEESERKKLKMATSVEERERKKLPVTLLSGFLGAGKSTLLRNILQAKHAEENFRCAVLVNDMAELNIDQKFIESSGLIRSDEVISMQNGCVCCSLSGDLVEQITKLATGGNKFDYMLIEASGVSEPAAIAALFAEHPDDHDHNHDHEESHAALGDVATLDTIVSVVDTSEFTDNLEILSSNPDKPNLLIAQIEYSNVVLLNKTDLVNTAQLEKVKEKVSFLNKSAKVVTCTNSTVDVKDVVDTGLFKANDFDFSKYIDEQFEVEKPKSCCKASVDRGESPCCKRARTIDSGKSQVLLPMKNIGKTRHGEKYQISSFVYKARRPFANFYIGFMDRFFISHFREEGEENEEIDNAEEEKEEEDADEEDVKMSEEDIEKLQEEGVIKKEERQKELGGLLRMKGFVWQANSHDHIGFVSSAGNNVKIDSPGPWNVLDEKAWKGTSKEKASLQKDWLAPYGDRRQELVFIGQGMDHLKIQQILDSCLITDEEYALGVDAWKAMFGDIHLHV